MNLKHSKTSLTFEEKIKAAYLYFYKGIDQHTIAEIAFDGVNQGRINEACVAVEKALKEGSR
ncbi:hypothetical protein [Bradyrhizobium stylosanthis]|uniref:hypothetical protein n=1 Tax=Bradyrhizobium stylosanthis TaxID=1803665 RepID=UPI0007C58871|nr:hypothetical protein [Bradyrhizobium stylosanthis]